MSLFKRLRYAGYLTAVGGATLMLLGSLATADVVGLLPPSTFELMFNPFCFVALYVVAFIVAPCLADYLPITRDEQ